MIVDMILDRKNGGKYNAIDFALLCNDYEKQFSMNYDIAFCMGSNFESWTKAELCKYIKDNNYNLDICDYINSVKWIPNKKVAYKIQFYFFTSKEPYKTYMGISKN